MQIEQKKLVLIERISSSMNASTSISKLLISVENRFQCREYDVSILHHVCVCLSETYLRLFADHVAYFFLSSANAHSRSFFFFFFFVSLLIQRSVYIHMMAIFFHSVYLFVSLALKWFFSDVEV